MSDPTPAQIRTKAAEISSAAVSRIVAAIIINDGVNNIKEISPLEFAKDIENYIRTGDVNRSVNIFRFRR